MNSGDAELLRDIRRELGRRPIDATRLDIECVNGRVSFGGTVTSLRDRPNASVREEMVAVERIFVKDRRVKAFSTTARVLQDENQTHEEHDSRGRMRR